MYRCPTCKSKDHLEVVVEVWAKLIQPDSEPEAFQTETDSAECGADHEWSDSSVMTCVNPECADMLDTQIAEHFKEEPPDA